MSTGERCDTWQALSREIIGIESTGIVCYEALNDSPKISE